MAVASGEIRSLTGLRGIAAIVVMIYHYCNLAVLDPMRPSPVGPGYLMVDLFFILSGFVMARTYGAAFDHGFGWRAYRGFLEARFARVYPLYCIVSVGVFLLIGPTGTLYPSHPVRALVTNLLLVQNLGGGYVCAGCSDELILPGWSISTEAAAYLAFPALATLALFRPWRSAWLLAGAAALALLFLDRLPTAWLHANARRGQLDISEGTTLWPLLRCLAGFSIGLVLWRVSRMHKALSRMRGLEADIGLVLGGIALWCLPGSDVLLVGLFVLLVLHLSTDRSPLARLLGGGLPHQAGEWSYAIYLLHWPTLMAMAFVFPHMKASHIPHAWTLALTLMAAWTIVLSALAHRIIERPLRQQLRSFFHRRRAPIALEPSAP